MAEAASRFLAALTPAPRSRAYFPGDSEERQIWDYCPRERRGLIWRELDSWQGKLAQALVATGLSHPESGRQVCYKPLQNPILAKLSC